MESVLKIVARFGGTRIPITEKPNNDLVELIGAHQARLLTYHYKNSVIPIPRCTKAFQAIRDNEIMTYKRAGKTLSELAITYQLTEVSICLALRHAEKPEYKRHLKSRNTKVS